MEFGLAAAAGLAGAGRNRAFDVAQVSLQGTGGELHVRLVEQMASDRRIGPA
jgi:hypothetical protein